MTLTFWNYDVLKFLRLETIMVSDATLSDINVVLCRSTECSVVSHGHVTQLPEEDPPGGVQAQVLHVLPLLLAGKGSPAESIN